MLQANIGYCPHPEFNLGNNRSAFPEAGVEVMGEAAALISMSPPQNPRSPHLPLSAMGASGVSGQ